MSNEPDDIIKVEGWLSPIGDWYSCDSQQHRVVAGKICDRPHSNPSESIKDDNEIELEEKGWLKVTHIPFGNRLSIEWLTKHHLTKRQMKTLYRWYKKWDVIKFRSSINHISDKNWFEFEKLLLDV